MQPKQQEDVEHMVWIMITVDLTIVNSHEAAITAYFYSVRHYRGNGFLHRIFTFFSLNGFKNYDQEGQMFKYENLDMILKTWVFGISQ